METMERIIGKSILVTGGTGLVGGHLVEALCERKCRVVVLYRSLDSRSYFASKKLSQKSIMVVGDLKDADRIFDIVTKYEIEYIFHLGAQAIVPTAYSNPLETIATNVMGTVHILEAVRRYPGIKGVVIASSDKAYGKSEKTYKESDPLCGDHPYEVSKSSADMIAFTYYKTYGLPIIITRFGNIYGPGDLNMSRIVPGIMKSILSGEKLVLRSDGTHIRDYIYVGDVVSGYLFLLSNIKKIKGEAFNLSSSDSISVVDLIRLAEKILHKKILYSIANTAVNEIPFQHLDYQKIQKFGWTSKCTLRKGLPLTYAWYLSQRNALL